MSEMDLNTEGKWVNNLEHAARYHTDPDCIHLSDDPMEVTEDVLRRSVSECCFCHGNSPEEMIAEVLGRDAE